MTTVDQSLLVKVRLMEGEVEVHPDMLVYAPAGVKHEMKNTSDETLKLICVYVPALKASGYFEEAEKKAKEFLSDKI